jgi:hypothetical protein
MSRQRNDRTIIRRRSECSLGGYCDRLLPDEHGRNQLGLLWLAQKDAASASPPRGSRAGRSNRSHAAGVATNPPTQRTTSDSPNRGAAVYHSEPRVLRVERGENPASRGSTPSRRRPMSFPDWGSTCWLGLQSVFPTQAAAKTALASPTSSVRGASVVAVFSMAGGVGKRCLVATFGRALSALGEHVLLADTAAFGNLPFYFGLLEHPPA